MPTGREPVCGQCGTKNSTIWHKTDPDDPLNAPLCSSCHAHQSPTIGALVPTSAVPSTSGGITQDGESSQEPGSPPPGTAQSVSNSVVEMIRSETFSDFGRRSRDLTPELGSHFKKEKMQHLRERTHEVAASSLVPNLHPLRAGHVVLFLRIDLLKVRHHLLPPSRRITYFIVECIFKWATLFK